MENMNISGNYVLNFNALTKVYDFFLDLLEKHQFKKLQQALTDIHINYNHVNPYSIRALIGEIAVKLPNKSINNYADYILSQFNISAKNLESYLENRIKMIISQDGDYWKESISKMFDLQASNLFQKSLILDKEFQENKLEANITNWPKKIMSA